MRFILNLRKFDHISEGYANLRQLKMEKLRDLQSLSLMHKIVNGKAPQYLTNKIVYQGDHLVHLTRARTNLRIFHFNTNYGRNCFFNNIGNKFNEILNFLNIEQTVSNLTFKNKVKNFLLNT